MQKETINWRTSWIISNHQNRKPIDLGDSERRDFWKSIRTQRTQTKKKLSVRSDNNPCNHLTTIHRPRLEVFEITFIGYASLCQKKGLLILLQNSILEEADFKSGIKNFHRDDIFWICYQKICTKYIFFCHIFSHEVFLKKACDSIWRHSCNIWISADDWKM